MTNYIFRLLCTASQKRSHEEHLTVGYELEFLGCCGYAGGLLGNFISADILELFDAQSKEIEEGGVNALAVEPTQQHVGLEALDNVQEAGQQILCFISIKRNYNSNTLERSRMPNQTKGTRNRGEVILWMLESVASCERRLRNFDIKMWIKGK